MPMFVNIGERLIAEQQAMMKRLSGHSQWSEQDKKRFCRLTEHYEGMIGRSEFAFRRPPLWRRLVALVRYLLSDEAQPVRARRAVGTTKPGKSSSY